MTPQEDEIHRIMAKAVTLLTIASSVEPQAQPAMVRDLDPSRLTESQIMMMVADLAFAAHQVTLREGCSFQEALAVIGTARAQFMPTEEEQ